jgi:hypothetical protein
MKMPCTTGKRARLLAVIGLAACVVMGCKKAGPPAGPAIHAVVAARTNAVAAVSNSVDTAYVSVFEDLPPSQAKDPFFPQSHRREPAAPVAGRGRGVSQGSSSDLVLKAIVRSARNRQVIINNEILSLGEEALVRVPSGHLHVTCVEIGEDYAIIKVEGEGEPKRLEMDQKK